jgi:hypothetical protein
MNLTFVEAVEAIGDGVIEVLVDRVGARLGEAVAEGEQGRLGMEESGVEGGDEEAGFEALGA